MSGTINAVNSMILMCSDFRSVTLSPVPPSAPSRLDCGGSKIE